MKTKVKILVGYHKKDKLFKNNILFPIHLGRKLSLLLRGGKPGNLQWLIDNMQGDDTGENISCKNKYLNEATGIFWAWKNYDKLGNPEYFGVNHYRRFFKFNYSNLEKHLKKYDLICSKKPAFKEGVLKEWERCSKIYNFKITDFENLKLIYKELYQNDYESFKNYIETQNEGGLANLFIMKKEDFFNYCEWIFPIVEKLENVVSKENRAIGMLFERLTSYYLNKLENQGRKTLKTSVSDMPPSYSLEYFLSQIFNIQKRIKTNGSIHLGITILGFHINIRIKEKIYN